MSHNGKLDDHPTLEMPWWMVLLVIIVMLLIAVLAFWHSARVSYESLPRRSEGKASLLLQRRPHTDYGGNCSGATVAFAPLPFIGPV
jgi:hypothetical protein